MNLNVLLIALLHVVLLITGFVLTYNKKLSGIFILSYFGSIILFGNFMFLYTGIVAERVLFLPSLWFISAFITGLYELAVYFKIKKRILKIVTYSLVSAIVISSISLSIFRNFQWKDRYTLMNHDIIHLEKSAGANFIYAVQLDKNAQNESDVVLQNIYYEKAINHYKQAIKLGLSNHFNNFNLALIYGYHYQDLDSAYKYVKAAYDYDNSYLPAKFQLAKAYYLKEQFDSSLTLFQELYIQENKDDDILFFYAQVLDKTGNYEKGISIAQKLINKSPASHLGYSTLGMIYYNHDDLEKAIPLLEKGILKGGRDEYVFRILLKLYLANGMIDATNELNRLYNKK